MAYVMYNNSRIGGTGAKKSSESAEMTPLTKDHEVSKKSLINKYDKILKRYWGWRKTGRRGVMQYNFNMTQFETDFPNFTKGRYSNEYIFNEGQFEVTVITGERQKIEVQLISK